MASEHQILTGQPLKEGRVMSRSPYEADLTDVVAVEASEEEIYSQRRGKRVAN